MGRAHEVRAKKMAQTNAAKSALCNRASKEIYMAAKQGVPDPKENLALRSAIEKFKGQSVPKDVIERAIQKAKGKDSTSYSSNRYEGFGPGNVNLIIDTLTDNDKRAFAAIRSAVTHKGGKLGNTGCVSFNFDNLGVLEFEGKDVDGITEALIMDEVDVQQVKLIDENFIQVYVNPKDFAKAKDVLNNMGITEFETNEIKMIPNSELVHLEKEDLEKFEKLLEELDEIEDVQAVYHNADYVEEVEE